MADPKDMTWTAILHFEVVTPNARRRSHLVSAKTDSRVADGPVTLAMSTLNAEIVNCAKQHGTTPEGIAFCGITWVGGDCALGDWP